MPAPALALAAAALAVAAFSTAVTVTFSAAPAAAQNATVQCPARLPPGPAAAAALQFCVPPLVRDHAAASCGTAAQDAALQAQAAGQLAVFAAGACRDAIARFLCGWLVSPRQAEFMATFAGGGGSYLSHEVFVDAALANATWAPCVGTNILVLPFVSQYPTPAAFMAGLASANAPGYTPGPDTPNVTNYIGTRPGPGGSSLMMADVEPAPAPPPSSPSSSPSSSSPAPAPAPGVSDDSMAAPAQALALTLALAGAALAL